MKVNELNQTSILDDTDRLIVLTDVDDNFCETIAVDDLRDNVLQNSGVTAGSYTSANITVNEKGIITSAENGSGGGSAGLLTGQTIFSLDPLTEAGLHLLNGSELVAGGIYDDFITNYIAPLYEAHPERFKTEEEWQEEYTQYGVCGYYVYTEGVSVRLPYVIGKVEGTLDANALGSVIPESLPNIKGNISEIKSSNAAWANGSINTTFTSNYSYSGYSTSGNSRFNKIDFDASRSSSTYQDNAPVKEQAIRGYLYIVVATVTKTDIQVDIDEIVTDLDNKADKDLNNVTNPIISAPFIIDTYNSGTSGYNIWSNGYCEQWGKTNVTKDNYVTVTFLKTFADTNYCITSSPVNNKQTNGDWGSSYGVKIINAGSFKIYSAMSQSDGTLGCYWKANGYLAQGEY